MNEEKNTTITFQYIEEIFNNLPQDYNPMWLAKVLSQGLVHHIIYTKGSSWENLIDYVTQLAPEITFRQDVENHAAGTAYRLGRKCGSFIMIDFLSGEGRTDINTNSMILALNFDFQHCTTEDINNMDYLRDKLSLAAAPYYYASASTAFGEDGYKVIGFNISETVGVDILTAQMIPYGQDTYQQINCSAKKTGITAQSNLASAPQTQKSGCYIATAVYGSYDCQEVYVLRRYRDTILANTWYGRSFVKIYYACSPTVVKLFGNTRVFNSFLKVKLDKMVSHLQAKGFDHTPYKDTQECIKKFPQKLSILEELTLKFKKIWRI